ncbi:MAG: ECF-type riboflavin transporter substrate-binding protein [Cellulosilyticaceae bacterium]
MEQTSLFDTLIGTQGLVAIGVVLILCIALFIIGKKKRVELTTKHVVAIGIGAALYAATSVFSINIAPNTSLRLAIALLTIFGALFGPIVGFLVGFIGHALNDAMMYGSIWWSWVFMSASVGLFAGFITYSKGFNVNRGKVNRKQIALMYGYAVLGAIVGSILSYLGDVYLYGEPKEKLFLQLSVANATNLIVVAAIGIPVVVALAKMKGKAANLEEDGLDEE